MAYVSGNSPANPVNSNSITDPRDDNGNLETASPRAIESAASIATDASPITTRAARKEPTEFQALSEDQQRLVDDLFNVFDLGKESADFKAFKKRSDAEDPEIGPLVKEMARLEAEKQAEFTRCCEKKDRSGYVKISKDYHGLSRQISHIKNQIDYVHIDRRIVASDDRDIKFAFFKHKIDEASPVTLKFLMPRICSIHIRDANDALARAIAYILEKNSDLSARGEKGIDPIASALFANNIELARNLIDFLEQKQLPIVNQFTQDLIAVSKGEMVAFEHYDFKQLEIIYRVANQTQHYAIVDAIYEQHVQEVMEKDVFQNKDLMAAHRLHPPLWAYNISQLRDYAQKVASQMPMIDETKLRPVHPDRADNDLFDYDLPNGEVIKLWRKPVSNGVGRILGRDYLEQAIKRFRLQDQYAVPCKFLAIQDDKQTVMASFTLPSASDEQRRNLLLEKSISNLGINFDNVTLYVEYIEPTGGSRTAMADSLAEHKFERELMQRSLNFQDADLGNFMKNPKDGKIYFVDTEDDKNFMSEYEGRIAPIKTINFHLATTDIKVEVPLAHFTKTV